jgi:malonate transporter
MLDPLLLLPDFLLILTGLAMCRFTSLGRPVWEVVERLVYHVLFPALLFASIAKSPLQPGDASDRAADRLLRAGLIMVSTLIGTATTPLWLAALGWWRLH